MTAQSDATAAAHSVAAAARSEEILAANRDDLARAYESGIEPGLRDRLALDESRIASIAGQLRCTAALPDPVGEVVRGFRLANGMRLRQVRVPFGVIGMIFEARPNVTADAAGLALKAGSAVILRGGSAARATNTALIGILRDALAQQGLPEDLIIGIDEHGRPGAEALMRARGLVDVLIPRGGAGLIRTVVDSSTVPVIETGTGNTHVLIDESADLQQAIDIVVNAKTQRLGVCNALETLLVHAGIAPQALPLIGRALLDAGVTLHADERARAILEADPAVESAAHRPEGPGIVPATDADWATEYLSADLAIRVVDDLDEALAHIREHSTGHTESILTTSTRSQERFLAEVDSAVVMVNASTRFSDGGEFGFGAEIGISTQKLHARGPMGLVEMTSTRWEVIGDGHVRP